MFKKRIKEIKALHLEAFLNDLGLTLVLVSIQRRHKTRQFKFDHTHNHNIKFN